LVLQHLEVLRLPDPIMGQLREELLRAPRSTSKNSPRHHLLVVNGGCDVESQLMKMVHPSIQTSACAFTSEWKSECDARVSQPGNDPTRSDPAPPKDLPPKDWDVWEKISRRAAARCGELETSDYLMTDDATKSSGSHDRGESFSENVCEEGAWRPSYPSCPDYGSRGRQHSPGLAARAKPLLDTVGIGIERMWPRNTRYTYSSLVHLESNEMPGAYDMRPDLSHLTRLSFGQAAQSSPSSPPDWKGTVLRFCRCGCAGFFFYCLRCFGVDQANLTRLHGRSEDSSEDSPQSPTSLSREHFLLQKGFPPPREFSQHSSASSSDKLDVSANNEAWIQGVSPTAASHFSSSPPPSPEKDGHFMRRKDRRRSVPHSFAPSPLRQSLRPDKMLSPSAADFFCLTDLNAAEDTQDIVGSVSGFNVSI